MGNTDHKHDDHDHEHDHEHDDHGHDEHNSHDHTAELRNANKSRVAAVFVMTLLFMIVEAVGGYLTNSLALLSDAGHMLTDTAALGLALFAFWLSSRPVSPTHNFGWHRAEILAAFTNGVVLFLLAGLVVHEAIERVGSPPDVKVKGMLVVSIAGLIVNLVGAYILSKGQKENLNLRAALFHVIGDAVGSVGAIAAAIIIMTTGWLLADPIVSFVIATIIVIGAFRLVSDSAHVILEGTPRKIDLVKVESAMLAHPMIENVHDLHVWTITSGFESLAAHVVLRDGYTDGDCIIADLGATLMEKFGISHTTIQVEREHCNGTCCVTCPTREGDEEGVCLTEESSEAGT